ncbi:WYL domain-containing protein [Brevibacillus dissolubilis]|uniref:WYL domain-containing protein n=1 Tax=Brevibacillus dissolubilis TaxID=1844116 RepID=UPI0021001241|nr:WYL domain-containing protein [Brevibacillus dissolubilis]
MLAHPAAPHFFAPETYQKLLTFLKDTDTLQLEKVFVEKAKSKVKQFYHEWIPKLRRIILNKNGLMLSCETKNGAIIKDQAGVPYRLEFSMVRKEWYLIWLLHGDSKLLTTPLRLIHNITERDIPDWEYERSELVISHLHEERKQAVTIEVLPEYTGELQRILYAFSCFEKTGRLDDDTGAYHLSISFLDQDSEYVLSKVRFLGKRIKVLGNPRLQARMLESAKKALERYAEPL